jgi:hypothetical protein
MKIVVSAVARVMAAAAMVVAPVAAFAAPASATVVAGAQVQNSIAERIDVRRTGGLIGIPEHHYVDTLHRTEGARLARGLAASAEFRGLAEQYGKPRCCDMFNYTVTVTYSDGKTKSVRIFGPAETPEILREVLRLTVQEGTELPVR